MGQTFLDVISPAGKQRLELKAEPVVVGRHSSAQVVLSDDLASRQHCVIEPGEKQGTWRVRDLNSRNGTRVNGQPVSTAELTPQDVVVIGSTSLRLINVSAPVISEGDDFEDQEFMEELSALAPPVVSSAPAAAVTAQTPREMVEQSGAESAAMLGGGSSAHQTMRRMAASLPNAVFEAEDISLVNHRGGVTHAARDPNAKRGQKDDPSGRESGDVVELLRLTLLICARLRATDIHLEPKETEYALRLRVDGSMLDVVRFDKATGVKLSALIKVLSDIDMAQRSNIQEGHFSAKYPQKRVDFRISFTPAMFGQKLVARILDASSAPMHVWNLQLPQWMEQELERAIRGESGMVLVCGPTGSGKTTTLYSALRSIDSHQRNVLTIEDPVEIQLDNVTQIPVDEKQGNTFPALLRSLLRQDPDAIMIGEIRDQETAHIALQAAITGHLVFSSLHTRDTFGTVYRLLDLGVEPFLLSQGLQRIVAQRLVKLLCPTCKMEMKPTEMQVKRMGQSGLQAERIYRAGGCQSCLNTGYAGRRAVFEMLVTNSEFKDAVQRKATLADLRASLAGTPFASLQQSAMGLVAEGTTSLEEVERAVGG